MKSSLIGRAIPKVPAFPMLVKNSAAKGPDDTYIVLMTRSGYGMVVHAGSQSDYPFGYYSNDWLDVENARWEPLPQGLKITLEA